MFAGFRFLVLIIQVSKKTINEDELISFPPVLPVRPVESCVRIVICHVTKSPFVDSRGLFHKRKDGFTLATKFAEPGPARRHETILVQ
jgi:hypothetical protein